MFKKWITHLMAMLKNRVGVIAAIAVVCVGLFLLFRPAGPPPDQDGKIVVEYAYPGLPHEKRVYQTLIREFEKEYPRIKVKEIHPAAGLDILQKLQIQMAGKVPPDVCWLDVGSVKQFAEQGGLMSLDGFIERDSYDLTDFEPQIFLNGARVDGKLYGIPRELNCCLTFYNKTMFDRLRLRNPEELALSGEWTWDSFVEVGRKLASSGDGIYSYSADLHHPWLLSPLLESKGLRMVDLDTGECFLDSPECVAVMSDLRDHITRYHIRPRSGEAEGKGDLFVSGQVAMSFVGRWMVPLYSQIDSFDWGVAPMPAGGSGSKTPLVGAYHCIPKGARHPDEAWELVKFLSGERAQRISAEMGLIIPVRRSVAHSEAFLDYEGMDRKYNAMFVEEISRHGVLLPIDEHWREMVDLIYKGLDPVFSGGEPVNEAARRVSREVEETLREVD